MARRKAVAKPKPVAYKDLVKGDLYGVVDKSTGELLSIGTVLAPDLPATKAIVPVRSPQADEVWNRETWSWDPFVPPEPTPEEVAAAAARAEDDAFLAGVDERLRNGETLSQEESDRISVIRLRREAVQ